MTAETFYEPAQKRFRIHFEQHCPPGQTPFHVPIQLALVDREGREVADSAQVFQLKEAASDLIFENLPEPPAFASMNRDYSFYGTFQVKNVTSETLVEQIRLDPNACNRVEAMRQLTDRQRIRLLENPSAAIDPEWLSVYGEILGDEQLRRCFEGIISCALTNSLWIAVLHLVSGIGGRAGKADAGGEPALSGSTSSRSLKGLDTYTLARWSLPESMASKIVSSRMSSWI